MSNLQQYSILLAVAGGTLLAEEQEIDFSRTANAVRVATVAKGFAGTSPGAPEVMVNVRGAMPSLTTSGISPITPAFKNSWA